MKSRAICAVAASILLLTGILGLSGCDSVSADPANSSDDVPATYTLGGTVTGLESGESCTVSSYVDGLLVESLAINENGPFVFPTEIEDGKSYGVTVVKDPLVDKFCVIEHCSGFITGAAVNNVAVTSQAVSNIVISGTVEDAVTNEMLEGIYVEATRPSLDTIITTCLTESDGTFHFTVQKGDDFCIRAAVPNYSGDPDSIPELNGTAYVPSNGQIQNEITDRAGIKIYMVDTTTVASRASALGFDSTDDAIFSLDIEDGSSDGIAGVTVSTSPDVSSIFYQQSDDSFVETAPTTIGGAVMGIVSAPISAGTYTITLTGATDDMTIDRIFQLRLKAGELSQQISL